MPRIKHYRQSRYKAFRKPVNKTLLIAIIAASVILVLSIALGSYLGKLSAPDSEVGETQPPEQLPQKIYDAYPKLHVGSVSSHPLSESAYLSDTEADSAILKANGAMIKALCVQLLDGTGAPRYKSDVYSRVYSAPAKGMDLALFAEKTEKSGISLTAVFPMISLMDGNSDIKQARQSFELSLIAEAYSCGVRDILLTEADGESTGELYSLMQKIKGLCPELAVGILISSERAADTLLCAELDDIFDYLAIDHTEAFVLDVADHVPKKERAEQSGSSSDTQLPQPSESHLYKSIYASLLISERFGARAYVNIGDGCEYCTDMAKIALESARIENYLLDLSSAKQNEN